MKTEIKDKDGNVIGEIYSDRLGNKFARNKEGVLVAAYNSVFKKTIKMANQTAEAGDTTEALLNEFKDMLKTDITMSKSNAFSSILKRGK